MLGLLQGRENKMGRDLAMAVIIGETYEFVKLCRVICCDLACPEGATKMVVSRMSTVALLMVPFAVSPIPKGTGRAIHKRTIL